MAPINFADEAHAAGAYIDPTDPQARKLIGSTTVIKKALPPYLVPWAAKLTAETAVDTLDSWKGLDRAAAVDLLKRAPDRNRDSAGDKGTIVHRVLELAATGQTPDEVYDANVAGYVSAGLRFLDDWQPQFLWNEATVFHPDLGYAGTLDFIAELPGLGLVIGDYKTSKGVYPEVAVQLASYRYASHALTHRADGTLARIDIPDVAGGVVVHIKGDGTYQLRPVDAGPEAFDTFRHCLAICDWKARKGIIAPHQPPPDRSSTDDGVTAHASPSVETPAEDSDGSPVTVVESSAGTHLDWLRNRVLAIVNAADVDPALLAQYNANSAGDLMAAWWPENTPTLREGGHSDAQLDAIAERCSMVEKALGLPFPQPTPAEEIDNVRVPADDPWVLDLIRRLHALPQDLLRDVESQAAAAGITAKVSLGLPLGKLRTLDAIVEGVEEAHQLRMSSIDMLLHQFDMPVRGALCGNQSPATFTDTDVTRLGLLVEAFATGYLAQVDGQLAASDEAADLLVKVWGNRRDALNHTKRQAKAHGLTAPSSFADILGGPLLVALAIASDEHAPATPAVA